FVVSAMQENQLHGWRLKDAKDMRMGGYPAKIRDLAFLDGGAMMATSGAHGAVVWPFSGANGPMGKEAAEVGYDETALVTRVAAAARGRRLAARTSDGRVWAIDLGQGARRMIAEDKGQAITALDM